VTQAGLTEASGARFLDFVELAERLQPSVNRFVAADVGK
jgi:hypothetical protein